MQAGGFSNLGNTRNCADSGCRWIQESRSLVIHQYFETSANDLQPNCSQIVNSIDPESTYEWVKRKAKRQTRFVLPTAPSLDP